MITLLACDFIDKTNTLEDVIFNYDTSLSDDRQLSRDLISAINTWHKDMSELMTYDERKSSKRSLLRLSAKILWSEQFKDFI